MSDQENNPPEVPYMAVEHHGQTTWFGLANCSNALIGSGGHCKIQLEGKGVCSLHCILALKDGQIELRDWNTGTTIVNGEAIRDPVNLNHGDRITIGSNEITVVMSAELEQGATPNPGETTSEEVPSPLVETANVAESQPETVPEFMAGDLAEPVAQPDLVDAEVKAEVEPETEAVAVHEPKPQPAVVESESVLERESDAAADAEAEACDVPVALPDDPEIKPPPTLTPGEFVYDIDADFEDDADDTIASFSTTNFSDEFATDELQTLRMENEQLRFELAQQGSGQSANSDLLSREQTVKLVSRLEDLLAELKRSDARANELEELLRSADQAAADEQEERKQLEQWVAELESRVGQRELENEAEVQQLRKQLDDTRESRQKSNYDLQEVFDMTGDGESIPVELANDLRSQIESLQAQLNEARDQVASLKVQLEKDSGAARESELAESERKLAAMQLEASRERAEISRQRAELKRLKSELEDRLDASRSVDVADTRIRAMREHLKELHDQEQQKKTQISQDDEVNAAGGLANRIASLLQRVAND